MQWDDALDYLEPLREPPLQLDLRSARFLLLKHKYLELLCLREGILRSEEADVQENGEGQKPENDPAIEQVFYSVGFKV